MTYSTKLLAALMVAGSTAFAAGCATPGPAGETSTIVVPVSLENNYLMTTRCRRKAAWQADVDDPQELGGNVLLDYGSVVRTTQIQYTLYTYSRVENVRAFRCPQDVLQKLQEAGK